MSEFSPQAAPIPPPAYTPPANTDQHWLKRPIVAGQSIPWLALYAVVFIVAGWYFFAPESQSSPNQLAFGNQQLQSTAEPSSMSFDTPSQTSAPLPAFQGADLSQMQDQVAAMVAGVRTYSEGNREAITKLTASLKTVIENQNVLQQQIQELQAKLALSSAPAVATQTRPVVRAAARQPARTTTTPGPLADMHLSAVQTGMAWVRWQDKTWAVQIGDTLGPVTVTGIDAPSRQVHTSAGTLQ